MTKHFDLLSESRYCLKVDLAYQGKNDIYLHFYCDSGNEEKLYCDLPLWFTLLGKVCIGDGQIYIKLKTTTNYSDN